MEKNTLLAVVLSVVVLIGFYLVQGIFFSPPPPETISPPSGGNQFQLSPQTEIPAPVQSPSPVADLVPAPGMQGGQATTGVQGGYSQPEFETVNIETDFLSVVLSNEGGSLVSFRLKRHKDGPDDLVEMIFSGESEAGAFNVGFGGPGSTSQTARFHVERVSEYVVRFWRDFPLAHDPAASFRLEKEYRFYPGEYMFELVVRLDGGHLVQGFDFGGSAYTLSFGPQIGPPFRRLDRQQGNDRQYFIFPGKRNGRVGTVRANETIINSRPQWAAIAGQYFTLIAMPVLPGGFDLSFSERPEAGVPSTSRMHIMRPPVASSRAEDLFRFYLGPRSLDILQTFNTGNNVFGLHNLQLTEMAGTRGFLAPLENVLKWLLTFFHNMIPNYGVSIILLTLLVRIAFFPLTKKGSESTLRMQAIAPKIKELQAKYKDNRQKLNAEMAELYKKEGYNPLKGCLPMLLQLPIFFAMFNLFRTHFELRGAMFIPGWIPDLSVAEYIWAFPDGVRLPLLGWDAIRLLPFIYVGSQLLYGKVTQTPDQKGNPQMKMMLYLMPIIFFFVLYNMPSGLLVYWIASNILTMVQQLAIMKYLAKKKAAQEAASPVPAAIAPHKGNGKATPAQSAIAAQKKRRKK